MRVSVRPEAISDTPLLEQKLALREVTVGKVDTCLSCQNGIAEMS